MRSGVVLLLLAAVVAGCGGSKSARLVRPLRIDPAAIQRLQRAIEKQCAGPRREACSDPRVTLRAHDLDRARRLRVHVLVERRPTSALDRAVAFARGLARHHGG
ncbi:MAG TPA: hypothetical protein VE753_02645 [Gaiellaceae bacterium]|jgi:hypothetical protein|nr:hypothetical protein [Gaiellaceae bacterium]